MYHNKTIRRVLMTIGGLFLVTQLLACSGDVGSGTLDQGIYSSDYFGFSLTLPDEWHPLDQKGMNAVTQAGSSAISGNNKRIKASAKAAENGSYNLVMAYQHPLGTRVPFNPSLGAVAQQVDKLPRIKSGRDYLKYIKSFMARSHLRIDFSPDIERINIGGVDFDHLYGEANMGRFIVSQEYYAAVQKGHVLSFVMSYVDDDQYFMIQESVDSIIFF